MMPAYDKLYLEKARTSLGRMLDFAVYDLKYTLHDFFELFIVSGVADRFEHGDFTVLAGKSGIELAYMVLDETEVEYERVSPRFAAGRSEEYWTGWALAYYQWHTAMRFAVILKAVSIEGICALYSPYHEMDIRHFVDKMNELCQRQRTETSLKRFRHLAGLSQRELAEKSGISLRTIQQYEQRQKNINKAQIDTLTPLSMALYCEVRDLLEPVGKEFSE
jgi:DNA-binding transcriptional regulator YiaG